MANAAHEHLCFFQWNILNPFVPRRNLEATFYLGSPITTQWRVTLRPISRGIISERFSFSLEFDEWFYFRNAVLADRILVLINLNGMPTTRKEVHNVLFCKEIRFKYCFETLVLIFPQTEPHELELRIEITLSDNLEFEIENGMFTSNDDLRWLSENMSQLLDNPQYFNMNLMSRDGVNSIPAHSYIIGARWDNFFKLHDFKVLTRDTVETNISEGLLSDILDYIYSGNLAGLTWPDWTSEAYITELFQVIDRYKLYHLYKVFVKNDLQQERVTWNSGIIDSHLFPLNIVNGRLANDESHTWYFKPDTDYEFIFYIRMRRGAVDCITYSLQSRSEFKVYAQISLEIVQRTEEGDDEENMAFYKGDWTVDSDATVESPRIPFSVSSAIFDLNSSPSNSTCIRCFLHVADGTKGNQVRNLVDDTVQDEVERFRVLSAHLRTLRIQPLDADMEIAIRRGMQGDHDPPMLIHKGIFASRVPQCLAGLENVPQEGDLPERAKANLSRTTLPMVLDYLYTGKIFTIPFFNLDEVENFARETSCDSLTDLVNRIRLRWIDQ